MSKNISSFNNNSIPNDDLEIDLNYLFKFFIRNKIFIGGITFLLTIGAFLFSFSLRKVWQGEFQIVVSEKKTQQLPSIDPIFNDLLRGTTQNDLKTQVGILDSPSVLMPIFEYVYDQKKLKVVIRI